MTGRAFHRLTLYKDAAGEYRWRLTASNGETVADSSESYTMRQLNDCLDQAQTLFEDTVDYVLEAPDDEPPHGG